VAVEVVKGNGRHIGDLPAKGTPFLGKRQGGGGENVGGIYTSTTNQLSQNMCYKQI